MKNRRMICLMGVLLSGLTLTAWAQKKPAQGPGRQINQGQNKQIARRVFEELTNQGRYGNVDEVFDRNCKVHFGGRSLGLQQAVAEGKGWKSAAPDFHVNVESITENGDEVTVVWTATGTHTGAGLEGHKPTGKRASVHETSHFRINNGKIIEAWNPEYRPVVYRQLGISKTTASLFDTTERLWAAIAQILPDPLYASLQ